MIDPQAIAPLPPVRIDNLIRQSSKQMAELSPQCKGEQHGKRYQTGQTNEEAFKIVHSGLLLKIKSKPKKNIGLFKLEIN